MKRVDFSRMRFRAGLASEETFTQDIREQFADLVYTRCRGVAALELARKIYGSDGETEYSDREVEIMRECAMTCTPQMIDAFSTALEGGETDLKG